MANNPRKLRPPLIAIKHVLDFYAQNRNENKMPPFCFQVGANDGKNNDPVYRYFHHYSWRGLLVEPQVDVFENGLKETYKGNLNVILENVALSHKIGELPFYRVAISKARWATGLSSFDKKSLLGHIENGYILRKAKDEGVSIPAEPEKIIEVVNVPTSTVEALFSKYSIDNFDVLCIDTEGYDFEILKLIDFNKYNPDIVLFESKNLSDNDFTAAKLLLTNAGYQLFWQRGDTLGIRFQLPFFLKLKLKIKAFFDKL